MMTWSLVLHSESICCTLFDFRHFLRSTILLCNVFAYCNSMSIHPAHYLSVIWSLYYHDFSARQVLLQSEEELLRKRSLELVSEGASMKPKKTLGKLKVQG